MIGLVSRILHSPVEITTRQREKTINIKGAHMLLYEIRKDCRRDLETKVIYSNLFFFFNEDRQDGKHADETIAIGEGLSQTIIYLLQSFLFVTIIFSKVNYTLLCWRKT